MNENDDDHMQVERDEMKKNKAQKDLEFFTLKKREEMKKIEEEANYFQMELEKKYEALKHIEANNAALQSKLEKDAENLNKEAQRLQMQTEKAKFEWEHKLKEECENLKLQHMEVMYNMKKAQEVEYKRLQEELKNAQEAEYKRLKDELTKKTQELDTKELELTKKSQVLDAKQVIHKDDHDPQYGIRNRKTSSPREKLTVTKSNVGTRSLHKTTKITSTGKKTKSNLIPNTNPHSKSNVITNNIPMVEEYNPIPHDEGHDFIWNGGKETAALKSVASLGLKLVSDTAANYITDMFGTDEPKKKDAAAHYIPDIFVESPTKTQTDGFEAQMGLGNTSFSDDEDEFNSVTL